MIFADTSVLNVIKLTTIVLASTMEMLLKYAMLIATLIGRVEDGTVTCQTQHLSPLYVNESKSKGELIDTRFIYCDGSYWDAFELRFSSVNISKACNQFSFGIPDRDCTLRINFLKDCIYKMEIKVEATQLDYECAELRECRRELIATGWADSAIVRVIVENEVSELLSPSLSFILLNSLVICNLS